VTKPALLETFTTNRNNSMHFNSPMKDGSPSSRREMTDTGIICEAVYAHYILEVIDEERTFGETE
jgi:hypothetical protein